MIAALLVLLMTIAPSPQPVSAKDRQALQRAIEGKQEQLARNAEASLSSFYRQQFNIVEKLERRVDNWHIDAICDHLQATIADVDVVPQINRLVINVPPRNGKSSTTCVALPAWTWGPRNLPGKKFMYITHSLKLSRRDSGLTRKVIVSPWYQEIWGDRFRLTSKTKDRVENDQTGYRMIGSFHGGSVIGEGADILGVDDPIDPDNADNPNELERIIETFDGALVGRLNSQSRGSIILIMQRLAEGDLCGHVLKQAGWQHLRLPTEFELEDRCRTFVYVQRPVTDATADGSQPVPLSTTVAGKGVDGSQSVPVTTSTRVLFFEDPRTVDGELLNPRRFSREDVEKLRTNEWTFAAQQQQRPAPRGGQIFQDQWWRYYDELPRTADGKPRAPDHSAQSWDLAFKDLKTSDYVAGIVGELYGPDIYLRDYFMDRRGFAGSCDEIRQMTSAWPDVSAVLVEDKANGPAVIETLHTEISGIIAVEPEGGKIARAFAAQPSLKAGNVYLPNPIDPQTGRAIPERAWVKRFTHNCSVFPKGLHDDDVDAFTQLVTYLRGTHSSMLDFLKQQNAKDAERKQRERDGRA